MNLDLFFEDNPDWLPFADLVALPPSKEEIRKEFKRSGVSREVLDRCMEVVREGGGYVTRGAIYVRIRREDKGVRDADRWATMLCLQAPPGLQTTDTFWSGRKTWVEHFGEEYANNIKAQFAKKGINLTANQEYMPELVRPGYGPHNPDPEAIVPFGGARSHIKKLCESRGWACLLPGQVIQGTFVGGLKSRYSGPAREIVTASGKRLSVTCNHPIVTSQGLVAAGDIDKGDDLLCYVGKCDFSSRDDKQQPPATVEEVFGSLSHISRPVFADPEFACDPLDLHGDAKFFDGNVEAVGTYRELAINGVSKASERLGDSSFVGGNSKELLLSGGCALDPCFDGASASVCVAEKPLRVPLAGLGGQPLPHQEASFGSGSKIDTILSKYPSEAFPVGAGFFSQISEDRPGQVFLDKVVEVRDFFFSGHVYDFHSPFGWIIANGLFVSNCEGAVNAKHRQPESDPLADEACVPMGEDLIRSKGRVMLQDNPEAFKGMSRKEAREKILSVHGPSKTKGRIVDVKDIAK